MKFDRSALSLGRVGLAALLAFAAIGPSHADTPCDVLRSYLRDDSSKQPEFNKGLAGAGLEKALARLEAKPDGKVGDNCAELSRALPGIDVDPSELEAKGDLVCQSDFDFYDEHSTGGFVLLIGPGGGMGSGCYDAMILLLDANHARLDVSWEACSVASLNPTWLHALRLNDTLYPATVEEIVKDEQLRYEVMLTGARESSCSLSVTYQLSYVVRDWFGPKGRDDVSSSLRASIEPILLEEALGRDGRQASVQLLDEGQGDSVYDKFLRGHPEAPIAMTNESAFEELGDGLDIYFALDDFGGPDVFDQFAQADLTPLRIEGRRYLLMFGFPIFGYRVARDPAFSLVEWTGSAFKPIASGSLAKTGKNPIIQ